MAKGAPMCSARYSKQCRGFGDCAGSPGLAFSLSQAATSVQRLLTCACRLCHLPAATSAVCLSLAVPQEKWKHLTAPEEPVEKQPKPCKPHVWWSEEDTDAAAQILGQLGKVLAGVAGPRPLPASAKASVPKMLDSAVSSASRSAGPLHLLRRAWACCCLVGLGKACLPACNAYTDRSGPPAWLSLRRCSALMPLELA